MKSVILSIQKRRSKLTAVNLLDTVLFVLIHPSAELEKKIRCNYDLCAISNEEKKKKPSKNLPCCLG